MLSKNRNSAFWRPLVFESDQLELLAFDAFSSFCAISCVSAYSLRKEGQQLRNKKATRLTTIMHVRKTKKTSIENLGSGTTSLDSKSCKSKKLREIGKFDFTKNLWEGQKSLYFPQKIMQIFHYQSCCYGRSEGQIVLLFLNNWNAKDCWNDSWNDIIFA